MNRNVGESQSLLRFKLTKYILSCQRRGARSVLFNNNEQKLNVSWDPGESQRLPIESPWSLVTRNSQRFGHP
eukprot:COSAG01_NODE_24165_length_788_cov_0.822932_1_plen_71_part_10